MVLATVVFFYGLKYSITGQNQFVVLGVFVIGVIASLLIFHKNIAEPQSFKTYFAEGFKAFIVATLIMVLFTFIFYKLNPQIMENGIAENNLLIQAEGNHTPQEIEGNSQKLRDIFIPMMLGITTVKYLILGALISLIGAGFLAKGR